MHKKLLSGIIAVLSVVYPFAIYLGIKSGYLNLILIMIAVLFTIRLIILREAKSQLRYFSLISLFCAVILCTLSVFIKEYNLFMYYPLIVNLLLLAVFFTSLFQDKTIIERFALMTEKNLPDYAVTYTRRVTIVWCIFFLLNGAIAFITIASGDIQVWTLYNGLIAYILIGITAAVEYIVRIIVRRKNETNI